MESSLTFNRGCAAAILTGFMLTGCGVALPEDSGGKGSGGKPGSGGTPGSVGTGGSIGSGGVIDQGGSGGRGSGGLSGSGGATGSGGNAATGGSIGSGGVIDQGGSGGKGSGGTLGSGGAMGSGGTGGSIGDGGEGAGGGSGRGGATVGSGGRGGAGNAGGKAGGGTQGTGGSVSGTGGTASACASTPLTGGTKHCSSNMSGNVGSYAWTIWSSGSGGCITPYGVGAAFNATWNNSNDFLARVGLSLGSNKTFDKFGTLAADYAETKTGSGGNFSYIGIYGWSVNPLHEYYIVDDWFGSRPSFAGDKVGSFSVDGGTYDILTHTQQNQPAITGGNATFVQFWSLRTTARQCGHISISEHFKAWANAGLTLGNMEEAKVLIEVGGGNGSIDFTAATITAQ
jgi:endo-1,4-beta-xylanase